MGSLPDADQALLRSATRRVGWQIAGASAVVVVIAGLATLALSSLFGHGREHGAGPERDDEILRSTLLIAGVIGVVIAGVIGFLIARRAVAPLGDALARQRQFVADAGHELRTPLTVVHTRAQLIARRMGPDDPSLPAMRQLLDDSRVLAEIVDELLASAALHADPARGECVGVRELLAEVDRSMAVLAEGRGVSVSVDAPDDELVTGSRVALRRAMTALLDNALGHTPSGGWVRLAATRNGDRLVLSVIDSGDGVAGLDPAELTRRFARGPRAADGPGGRRFGLGLALVREIAVAHGGSFSLGPAAGGGARADIELPARR